MPEGVVQQPLDESKSVSYTVSSGAVSPEEEALSPLPESEAAGGSVVISTLGSAAIYTVMTLPTSTMAPGSSLQ